MRTLKQDLSSGETAIFESPIPQVNSNSILINSKCSLISAGTERSLIEFSKASYIQKARQQPDKVRQVLDKVRTDGLVPTIEAVKAKISEPMALGYSLVGEVDRIGQLVTSFSPGDRVVCVAPHADMARVTSNMAAKIPDRVKNHAAAFSVVGSVALQGIRLASPQIGEFFVVNGVGLIGQLAAQILLANGCKVLALDYDQEKLEKLRPFGAFVFNLANDDGAEKLSNILSNGHGADGVLVCAATKSSDPMNLAARLCRPKGRVVQVGVTGLDLVRSEFYEKEISVAVSSSFGAGRYDENYTEGSADYPISHARWTVGRNLSAFLDLLDNEKIVVDYLCTGKFDFEDVSKAYGALEEDPQAMGIIIDYQSPPEERKVQKVLLQGTPHRDPAGQAIVGMFGAGNYASRVLAPAFKSQGARLHTIVSSGGDSAAVVGRRSGFDVASSDSRDILACEAINTVAIATRHDSHVELCLEALYNGKSVYLEKPLAIDDEGLKRVKDFFIEPGRQELLMVGFNRRFSPQAARAKALLKDRAEPLSLIITVNAGTLPAEHWQHDRKKGGGRIIGEGCHFIDLARFLVGQAISEVFARSAVSSTLPRWGHDKAMIHLLFADGSIATIHYLANGSRIFPKERIDIFSEGRTITINNFRKMQMLGFSGASKFNLLRQDKGHIKAIQSFVRAMATGSPSPIPVEEILEVSEAAIEADRQIRKVKGA